MANNSLGGNGSEMPFNPDSIHSVVNYANQQNQAMGQGMNRIPGHWDNSLKSPQYTPGSPTANPLMGGVMRNEQSILSPAGGAASQNRGWRGVLAQQPTGQAPANAPGSILQNPNNPQNVPQNPQNVPQNPPGTTPVIDPNNPQAAYPWSPGQANHGPAGTPINGSPQAPGNTPTGAQPLAQGTSYGNGWDAFIQQIAAANGQDPMTGLGAQVGWDGNQYIPHPDEEGNYLMISPNNQGGM